MRKQFKNTMLELAQNHPELVVVLGDISHYLFADFEAKYPKQFFNMGICENTLISVCAGLSARGFVPYVHTINPFLTERSFEQVKLDLCYNDFPAKIVTCGASFDYAWDGATHHCYTEVASFRLLPKMEVIQPGSQKEVDVLIKSQHSSSNPTYFRLSDFPHGIDLDGISFGKGIVLKDVGSEYNFEKEVLPAVQDLSVNLVYFHTIKPIDVEIVKRFSKGKILVVEDAFGLTDAIHSVQPNLRIQSFGIPDQFCVWYGTVNDIRREIGLDSQSLRSRISEAVR